MSTSGTAGDAGGSDPPKLVSLLALHERAGGEIEDLAKSAFAMRMEHNNAAFKKAVEEAPHVSAVADRGTTASGGQWAASTEKS